MQIQKYMAKISGPLLDRIDLNIEVPAVKYKELSSKDPGERSATVRERVRASRMIQRQRFTGRSGIYRSTDIETKDIHIASGVGQ